MAFKERCLNISQAFKHRSAKNWAAFIVVFNISYDNKHGNLTENLFLCNTCLGDKIWPDFMIQI
jgi:hypothetical protein